MNLELIAIGSEVLSGHTVNSNCAFLARHLSSLGYQISRQTTVSDSTAEIKEIFEEAKTRSRLIIATGGLGPTIDDVTKQVADSVFPTPTFLKNSIGTAPGLFYRGESSLLLLPGVPREMEVMFLEQALPILQNSFPPLRPQLRRGCYLCLLKEIEVNPFLEDLQKKFLDVRIGIYPSGGFLFIEFVGFSKEPLLEMEKSLRKRFATFFVGSDRIAPSLHRELIARKKTLALAESCTGGAISALLTNMPDASLYFLGSLVVYSNRWKENFLQVSHSTLETSGAVSSEVVREMSFGLFQETDADFTIAVSGVLGPSGGSEQKPVGTVYLAIGERNGPLDLGLLHAPNDRLSATEWLVQTSLGALWRRLVHGALTFS